MKTITVIDILDMEELSVESKLEVALNEELIPGEIMRKFARWCVLQVIDLWPDAPPVVREFLETGDETKREAAKDAWYTSKYGSPITVAVRFAADYTKKPGWAAWCVADYAREAGADGEAQVKQLRNLIIEMETS